MILIMRCFSVYMVWYGLVRKNLKFIFICWKKWKSVIIVVLVGKWIFFIFRKKLKG